MQIRNNLRIYIEITATSNKLIQWQKEGYCLYSNQEGKILGKANLFIQEVCSLPGADVPLAWKFPFFFIGYVLVIEFTLNSGPVNEGHNGLF